MYVSEYIMCTSAVHVRKDVYDSHHTQTGLDWIGVIIRYAIIDRLAITHVHAYIYIYESLSVDSTASQTRIYKINRNICVHMSMIQCSPHVPNWSAKP